jgi:hypothetical protein
MKNNNRAKYQFMVNESSKKLDEKRFKTNHRRQAAKQNQELYQLESRDVGTDIDYQNY